MARSFNGTSDRIDLTSGALPDSTAISYVAICRPTALPTFGTRYAFGYYGANSCGIGPNTAGTFVMAIDGSSYSNASITAALGEWQLVAGTKAPGTTTPRLHRYLYSTGAASHADAASSLAGSTTARTSLRIGSFYSGSSGYWAGDIAAIATYGFDLTDEQVESMAFSLSTWLAYGPATMWVLDQHSTGQLVRDWTGGGANQSGGASGTTVATTSVPILGYGHPVLLSTREGATGGGTTHNADATLAATAGFTADAAVTRDGASTLAGTATLTGDTTVEASSTATLDSTGALTGTAAAETATTSGLDATGDLTATGDVSAASPLLSTLVDNFDDNTIADPPWAANYGTVSETGGRARVACASSTYSGYQTNTIYTFDRFAVNVPVIAALNGATTECYTAAWVFSGGEDPGSHVGFLADRTTGLLWFMDRTGYVEPDALSVDLDETEHAWWRLQLDGGFLVWETSPDGVDWTWQRFSEAPAWLLTATDCKLLLEAHRSDGADNFSEFDNLNVAPPAEGAATFPGSGGLSASAVLDVPGSASLDATGVLDAAASITGAVDATLGGAAGLDAAADLTRAAAVTAAATGGLAAAGERTGAGAASLDGTSGLAAAGERTQTGAAVLAGTAALTGTGALTLPGAAALDATAGLTGTAQVTRATTVTFDATGTLTAVGVVDGEGGNADLTGTAGLAGTTTLDATATASLAGSGGMSAAGARAMSATSALTATAGLTGAAETSATQTALLPAQADLAGAAGVERVTLTTLAGVATLAAAASGDVTGTPALTATAGLSADAAVTRAATATLTAVGVLTASTITARRPGVLTASTRRSRLTAGTVRGPLYE